MIWNSICQIHKFFVQLELAQGSDEAMFLQELWGAQKMIQRVKPEEIGGFYVCFNNVWMKKIHKSSG